MLSAQYANVGSWIVDIIAVIAIIVSIIIFFIRKKSIHLLIIYLAVMAGYIGIIILDEYFNIPATRALAQVFVIFMVVAVGIVYQSNLKVLFLLLQKQGKKCRF